MLAKLTDALVEHEQRVSQAAITWLQSPKVPFRSKPDVVEVELFSKGV